MIRKIFILIVAFLILDATSAQAQGRVPYYVTRLARGTNPLPLQITKRLASVEVPGFGNLFHAIDRSSFLTRDTYGLNIHSIIAMHESLFPNKRKLFLPEGMGELKKLEDNVPNLITNRQNEDGWKFPPSKTLLFESAIPAYLVTSAEEKIVLPSAAQLSGMITYYHQVLADPRGRFAQQMSAVTNLGLFGTSEDAVSILNLAQADFESFNPFKDAFITRALLSLRAYNELQQLAQIRLAETNSNKEPVLLSPVWNGVQQVMLERKKNLHIPSERIASTWETSPDVVNREIIARHPFAYVLANTSEKVTRDWLALRDSIDEQFNQAVMKENVVSQLRRDLSIKRPAPFTPPTIPAVKLGTGFNWPTVKPKTSSTPAPETVTPTAKPATARTSTTQTPVPETAPVAKPAPAQPTVSSAESIALPTPPKEKTPRKKQSVQPPAKKPAGQPQNTVTRARRSSDDFNKIQQVHLTLETYLKEHDDQLPPDGHALRFAVYRILKDAKKNDPDNPEAKALSDLWKSHLKLRGGSNGQAHHYDRTRQELEQYVAEHGALPPDNDLLRKRAKYVRATGDPQDPDVKAITELLSNNLQKTPRTPAAVRAELETYMQEHDGHLPPHGSRLSKRAKDVRDHGDPNNPDQQAITALLTEKSPHTKRDPASVRRDFEKYLAEHNGSYPPNSSALNQAIYRLLKQNPTDENENIKAIRELWNKHYQKHPTRAPATVRAELETYMQEHDGHLPPNASRLSKRAKDVRDHGDPNDPDQQAITALLTEKSPNTKRDPASVRRDFEKYLAEHNGSYPPNSSALTRAIYRLLKQNPTDENGDIKAIRELWDKHYQKHPTRAPRNSHTPAQILAELTAYFETNETLPPNGSLYQAMRKALQKDKKNPQRDPTVLAIEQLWESRRQLPRYTTQEVYQNIVKFYEENGHLPKGVHKLYTLAYARMNNPELQNDPYVQALKQFWQEKQIQAIKDFGKTPKGERTNHNVSTVSTPREQVDPSAAQTPEQTLAQLQEKLNRFIKEHGRIPSENSTDPEEQNLRRAVQNLLNTALQLSALLTSR